jgi:hypothetical protein
LTFFVADTFLGSAYEYNKEKKMTHKKKTKKGQRLWKKPTISEKKENEERDYSFLFFFNTNIVSPTA